jgi:hypothetical protein
MLKKAKMKVNISTHISPQRGVHTALAQNKKKAFYLQCPWLCLVLDLFTLPKGALESLTRHDSCLR